MTKTRDKLSFFYSETSQFLYLVALLVACAKLSDSRPRDVAKIKQTLPSEKKTRAISTGKRYCTLAVLVNQKHTETNSIGWLVFRSPYLTKPGCLATAAREKRQSRVAIQ